jgi:hypothetical protein
MTTMPVKPPLSLVDLIRELEIARRHTVDLVAGLDPEQIVWRPHEHSSAIGWHLGHQAAVCHYMVRNLTAAEPPIDRALDVLFDSATSEPDRSPLPSVTAIFDYRDAVEASATATLERIVDRDVGAPNQLTVVAGGLVCALINHEYQHSMWIGEVRDTMIGAPRPTPASDHLVAVDGYWTIQAT